MTDDRTPPDDPGFQRQRGESDGGGLLGWLRKAVREADKLVADLPLYPDVLTYREVLTTLVTMKPSVPGSSRGALLRQARPSYWVFRILFLDPHGDPVTDPDSGRPAGRVMRAKDCDDELSEMFGNNDLIVFE